MSRNDDDVGEFRYTRYHPRLPALSNGRDEGRCPVAIVGGGPVGLALALGLANWGVKSVVIEADDSVCIGSRAACISRRSLEILDRLAALPAFLAKGLAWTGGRSFYRTEEVFRFEMPHDERQRLPPMINLQQYYIEQYLVNTVERRNRAGPEALIDLRWAAEVTGFRQHTGGVDIDVRTPLGRYAMRADWLAACDGGQSLVRRVLDLPLLGTAYEGRYVIIDIHLPSSHPTERRAWFDPPWNPGATVLMHRQADDIWRIDYQLRAGADTQTALQPENVHRFVQKHLEAIGEGDLPWRTIWTSIYRAGAMTLESYRHDRVLFAGNAAHAMPIFGVRGLNSGFDDADNLAWKLGLVVGGQAGERLLDSYSQERIAAFHANADSAMRSTEFMSPPSRGFDLLREAALSLASEHRDIARLINPRQTEAVPYPDSPLSSPDDAAWPGTAPGTAPGFLLPDFPLRELPGHLTGLLKPSFALVALWRTGPISAAVASAVQAAAQPDRVPLQRVLVIPAEPAQTAVPADARAANPPGTASKPAWTVATADRQVFDALANDGNTLYLLRPDRHVAARWRWSPADDTTPGFADILGAALQRACGHGATEAPSQASAGRPDGDHSRSSAENVP